MAVTTQEMYQMLSRVKNIVKLYHRELEGHLKILLTGDFNASDMIFEKRQDLDREIVSYLTTKIGKETKQS